MDKCIMPEMPYCPACKYGHIKYPDDVETPDDIDGSDCKWICNYNPEKEIKINE